MTGSRQILKLLSCHFLYLWGFILWVCIHSTIYNFTIQLSLSLRYCLMVYCDSLYSQHILQPYCTAVLLTTTLSDAVQWQFVFTAHSATLLYSCPAHYDCLMVYSDSLYSQHILQPYCTAVLRTMTLSDAVQWQFLFTAHSTALLYSCPAHYNTVWWYTVTVIGKFAKLCIWTRLTIWEVYSWISHSLFKDCTWT